MNIFNQIQSSGEIPAIETIYAYARQLEGERTNTIGALVEDYRNANDLVQAAALLENEEGIHATLERRKLHFILDNLDAVEDVLEELPIDDGALSTYKDLELILHDIDNTSSLVNESMIRTIAATDYSSASRAENVLTYWLGESFPIEIPDWETLTSNKRMEATKPILQPSNLELVLSPNPSVDKVQLASNVRSGVLSFYDMSNRLVKEEVINSSFQVLDVSDLKEGTYLLKLVDKGQLMAMSRLVILR